MAQEVARGEIVIEVNDREALANLRRIDDQFERTMRDIDREEAKVKLEADVDNLRRDLHRAAAEVQKYQKKIEDAESAQAKANMRRKEQRLQGEVEVAKAALLASQKRLRAWHDEGRALQQTERRIQAVQKAEEARERVFEQLEKRRQAVMRQTARVSSSLNNQRIRELKAAEREAYALNVARERELASIPKLQRGYAELEARLVKLAAARRKARGNEQAVTLVRLRERETVDQMNRLMARLRSLGQDPVSIHVNLERGATSGRAIREAFDTGGGRAAAMAAGVVLGGNVGRGVRRGLAAAFPPTGLLGSLTNAGLRGVGTLRRTLEGLTNMTVRVGPFTATLRQLAVAMTLFAPSILDLVGSLGSLIGVMGSATVGLGALSVGFLGGAIPAAIGMVTVLKPMIEQFKEVTALSESYSDAVLKYGKNSDQAKDKLKQMNKALGNVDAETRKAFKSAGTLASRWENLTQPARASAFNVMGKGIKFLSDNLGFFARRTNRTFEVAEGSLGRWLDALNTAEGRNVLGKLMDNFNASLGPGLDGMGNLLAYFGKVGAAASRHLPILARQFENWSADLLGTADDAGALQERVDGVVNSLRTFGRFMMSSGRFLKNFFGAGVGAGETMLDTMSNALDRWNRTLQTTTGQQNLANFFDRSVAGAQALYSTFAPLISLFVTWAGQLSPVVTLFFQGVGAVSSFATALLRVTALQEPLSALVATLGALWAVNRIGAAAAAVSNFATALFGMQRAAAGVATTTAAVAATQRLVATSTATSTAAMATTGAAAGAAGSKVGTLRAAATRLIPAIGGLGAVAGGLATAGLATLAAGAVYGAYKLVTMKTRSDELREQFDALGERGKAAGAAMDTTANALGDTGSQAARANLNLKAARERLNDAKKGTDEYRLALLDYRDAQRYAMQAEQAWTQTTRNYQRAAGDNVKINQRRAEIQRRLTELTGSQNKAEHLMAGRIGQGTRVAAEHREEAARLAAEYQRLTAAAERAANRQAAAPMNIARGYRGLLPVIGQAEQQLGRLARQSRSVATRIAIKFDAPKDVGRVASRASAALKAGVPQRIVTRIVVNSRDAEQALRRLDRYNISRKEVQILQRGGQQAIAMIERIIGRKLTPKEQKIAERGGDRVVGMLEKIIRRRIGDKSFSINARDNASRVIGSVTANLNALDGRVANSYVVTHYQQRGNATPMSGMRAGGGDRAAAAPSEARAAIRREMTRMEKGRVPTLGRAETSRGRKITQPTLLTGEERRSEFVIATNPRYRKSNLRYWRQAGQALGVMPAASGFDIGDQGSGFYAEQTRVGSGMRPKKGGAQLGNNKLRGMAGKRKKRNRIYTRQDNWSRYIGSLHTLQTDWEREASIREQAVIEPETLLREVERIPGQVLPDGSKTEDIVKYDLDAGAIGTFKGQLTSVKDAYDRLVAITNELVGALPRALNAADNEWRVRDFNIDKFRKARDRHRNIARNAKSDKVKAHHTKIADQKDKQLQAEKKEQQKLGGNIKQYREDRKEAGFDQREYTLNSEDYARQISAVDPRANEEKTQKNEAGAGGAGGGAGGAGSQPLSYGAQSALADSEKANVLREFGGNMASLTSALTGAAATGTVGGALTALATNPTLAGGASSLSAGGTALSGGSVAAGTTAAETLSGASSTGTVGGVASPTGSGDTTVSVTNNYLTQPEDPHTWAKGIEFEVGAALS